MPTSCKPIDVPMTWLTGQFVDSFRVRSLFYDSFVHFFQVFMCVQMIEGFWISKFWLN